MHIYSFRITLHAIHTVFVAAALGLAVRGVGQTSNLPEPWAQVDIGKPAQSGAATYTDGVFQLECRNAVWKGSSDQFHFVHQPLARRAGIVARLIGQQGGLAALMIRENLADARCREVWMSLDPAWGQRLFWRAEATDWNADPRWFHHTKPYWVKLIRAGDWFLGFLSDDGVYWAEAGATRVSMADTVSVGLVATGPPSAFDQVITWTGPEPGPARSLRREVWLDLPGTDIADLTGNPAFHEPAALDGPLALFESEGLGSNYGQRVSGFLVAPETGPFVFHLASDGAAQLWLSPDAQPTNRILVVEETAAGARRDWARRSSPPIALEAGQLYYVEALQKHGPGAGYLGVAWTLPYRLPPAKGSDPLSGEQFLFELPADLPRILEQPQSMEVLAGLNATLRVAAEGLPLSFQWRRDGQDLGDTAWVSGAKTTTLHFSEVRPADAGHYTVLVRNLAGSVESQPALLTVGLPYGEQPIPPLQLRLEHSRLGEVRLSWPRTWEGASVETTDDLSPPASWAPWNGSPQQDANEIWVWLATTNEQRYFRLRASSQPPPSVNLPPDPAATAPVLPASVVTTISEATRFLYTGPNPVQLGVTNGTIQTEQAAVVRGRVVSREGTPLPGVDVRILGRPEFGYTRSRTDGAFDLAVNGGGSLTVRFQHSGYLSAQRQVHVPWQDYVQMEEVALVPQDPMVTSIDLSSANPMQVARGGMTADQDGTRQATLFFPQGTRATMTLPDGSTHPLTTMHVRATEYTVGPNGPKAMPAGLPPTIGYTYCVELGVDEADAAGAKNISFDQPILFYVENFLGFPVGGLVPAGYYDKEQSQWVPSANGRVVKILGLSGGLAELDISGSNVAADEASLAALGITDDERRRLAALYVPGQSLWRVPLPHLSTWDCNWGWGPPLSAVFPKIPSWLYEDPQPDKPCSVQNQICRQSVNIPGTGYSLNYSSDRTPGYTAANTVELPYSHTNVPPSTKRIDVILEVNGRKFTNSFTATPNGRFSFLWDGKDAYGRQVQGCQRVTVRVGFVYDGKYQSPAALYGTFGHNFEPEEMTVNSRQECTFWQQLVSFVGGWHSHGLGFGGWSLNNHHAYDPISRTVYYGDGRKRQAVSTGRTIDLSAGSGTNNWAYGIPVKALRLYDPQGVAVASSGELYIADTGDHRILKVDQNGIVRHVAGNAGCGGTFGGDGGPATSACLNRPTYLAFGPDDCLYFTDSGNDRIRRIDASGIITTVAGGGNPPDGLGDGGAATNAVLVDPKGIAVARDGRLFIADYGHSRVRVVTPSGIIQTAAGGGTSLADGAPAAQSKLGNTVGLAVAPDGTLYLSYKGGLRGSSSSEICRVDPRGRLYLFAGAAGNVPRNGTNARIVALQNEVVAVGPDGDVYVCASWFGTVLCRIGSDGLIRHVAGKLYSGGYGGNGGPAVGALMGSVFSMAFGPDGRVYWTEKTQWGPHVIRHATLPLPGFDGGSIRIPSEDGAEVYEFDEAGRHLRTLDSLTGGVRNTFLYDPAGLLASVTDGDGNVTTVERAADGRPLAIVGPFGHRTTLETDADGNLSRIVDPANQVHQFSYRSGGLLDTATNPRTNSFRFDYDGDGRLIRDELSGCCAGQMARTTTNGVTTVTATSPEGRTTRYAWENLPSGESRQRNTFSDGTCNELLFSIDASRITAFGDGTVVTDQDGGDVRFGMESPFLQSQTIRTPGGRTLSLAAGQAVRLADPADPLSHVALTNTVSLNGNTFSNRYDAATRTFASTSPEGRQSLTTVDEQARPTAFQMPGVEPLVTAYDAHGRLAHTAQGVRRSGFAYDAATGFLAASTNALGEVTAFQRDAVGRVTTLTLPDGANWVHGWDAKNNLAMLAEPNGTNLHQFTYTPQDLMETYRSPLGATETFAYNKDKELIQRQFPSGQALQWNYATNGQLASLQTPEGSHTFTYHATNGQLATATSRDGQQVSYTYDGSLLTGAAWSGVVTGAVSYTYNNDFRVTQLAYAGLNLPMGYDRDGLLTNAGPINLAYNRTNGFLERIAEGAFTIAYQRNEFGEITNNIASQGAELSRVDRSYDALGRITRKTETISGTTVIWDYTYDTVGQLVEVKRDGVTVETYAYDAVGNRLGMTNTLTGETLSAGDYRYDADNKLLQAGSRTLTYDADGRLGASTRAGATTAYHYNTDGTLAGVDLPDGRQITYLHDSLGRRIARAVNGVRTHAWLYGEGLMPLAEFDGNGALRTTFIYGGRWTPVAFIRNGATNHIVTDHLGSPRLVLDASGAVIKRMEYDAFGNVVLDTAPTIDLPFGFAGGMADPDHELIRFGARDYQPSNGRWTAKDTILFEGGLHFYGYVNNDPVNEVDRQGLQGPVGCSPYSFQVPSQGQRHIQVGPDSEPNPQQIHYPPCQQSQPDKWQQELFERMRFHTNEAQRSGGSSA